MRFYADVFDADGLFYVFDDYDHGAQAAGPFHTLEKARAYAALMNENATT